VKCNSYTHQSNSTYVKESLRKPPHSISVVAGLFARCECASGRSCDRSSRNRFSWFSSVFKQMLRCSEDPICYFGLPMQPSRFDFIKIKPLCCPSYQILISKLHKFEINKKIKIPWPLSVCQYTKHESHIHPFSIKVKFFPVLNLLSSSSRKCMGE
jgi:hypothetical protein